MRRTELRPNDVETLVDALADAPDVIVAVDADPRGRG